MHTCDAPSEALDGWLENYPSTEGNYGHLLLEQSGMSNDALLDAFRPYFESAHLDAREYFHEEINIDLHPDASAPGANAAYPTCLPSKTRRGLFGEVMAGMLTEHYEFVGNHKWKIPIFLFRHHSDVEQYLFALARDPTQKREVMGRHGSDFLAIAIDHTGRISRFLAGEAKWRQVLSESVFSGLLLGKKDKQNVHSGKGIWHQFNERDTDIPHGMRQLQKLLKERDPDGFSAAILSVDEALMLGNPKRIPRTNLVFICGNDFAKRNSRVPVINWEEKPAEYKSHHDLQVIELYLTDGEVLIEKIYDCLWSKG